MNPQRAIRSFVRRQGRITPRQEKACENFLDQYGLRVEAGVIEPSQIFSRQAPLVLEIGFGMGHALLEMATSHPEWDYLGVEVHRPGIGHLLAEASARGLTNLRIFTEDVVQVLNQAIPDESLSQVLIFFPDPWPKKRHHKRRLIQPEFVALVEKKLQKNGTLHLATDWEDYAQHMLSVLSTSPGWQNQAPEGSFIPRPLSRPVTKFEQRGERLGHSVWDLLFQKTL